MEEEHPPETIAEVVDDRPLNVRIGDKNWKTRMTAYDEIRKLISSDAEDAQNLPIFDEFASWLPKMTSDSNAGALDSGLETALCFLDKAPSVDATCQPHLDKLIANAVEKTFSGRASTLAKGKALLHKIVEVTDPTACTEFLLTKLTDKKPKVPTACLDVLKEGIEYFGVRVFPVKDIIKALPAVFNGSNGTARDSAMGLAVELYRWVRLAPLQPMLDGLRTAQKTDFEKLIADKSDEFASRPAVPSLYLRKDRPAPGSSSSSGTAAGTGNSDASAPTAAAAAAAAAGGGGGGDELDSREFVDDVDLWKRLKSTEYSALIADEKWNEQMRALQLVIDTIGPVPKIKPGTDVSEILAAIKGFLRQGHLQLQTASLKILALLSDGLRKEFASSVRPLMQQIVLKSKEKRLVADVQNALLAIFKHCCPFDCVNDDIIEFISNKKSPPHGKVGLMDVVARTCSELPDKIVSDSLKPLATTLVGESGDPDPKVRDACAAALAAVALLAKSRGRLAAEALRVVMNTEQSAPKVFKKVQSFMTSPTAAAPAGAGSAADATTSTTSTTAAAGSRGNGAGLSAPKASSSEPTKAVGSSSSSSSSSSSRNNASLSRKSSNTSNTNALSRKSSNASNSNSTMNIAAAADDDTNVEDLLSAMSLEDAVQALEAMEIPNWGTSIQTNMVSTKWQEKVEAMNVIETRCAELGGAGGGCGPYSAALVKFLASSTGGFKGSNVNVLKGLLQTCNAIVKNSLNGSMHKGAAWEILKSFGDKLPDKKLKDAVQALLTAMCESCGAGFVVKRMQVALEKVVSPVARQHYLEWLKQAVVEFGCHAFPIPALVAFCLKETDHKNASVRGAAVEVMGALHFQIGPRLGAIAFASGDLKPQLKTQIEAEFARVGHDPNAAAAAAGNKRGVPSVSAASGNAAASSSASAMMGGIPRQDLIAMVDKNIISELNLVEGKTSWQNRKAAMESIIAACERSAHYLEANKPTGEIVKALKPRMADTQANLKPIAVSAIGHIVASLDCEGAGVKVLKSMGGVMLGGLGDNKKSMRDATIVALQHAVTGSPTLPAAATAAGEAAAAKANPSMLGVVVPAAVEALSNVVGRQELLTWLLLHVDALRADCSDLVAPLVLCLQDKSAAVRALAEQLLVALQAAALVGRSVLDKATRDLAPAAKRSIQVAVDRASSAYGTRPKDSADTTTTATAAAAIVVEGSTRSGVTSAPSSPSRRNAAAAAAASGSNPSAAAPVSPAAAAQSGASSSSASGGGGDDQEGEEEKQTGVPSAVAASAAKTALLQRRISGLAEELAAVTNSSKEPAASASNEPPPLPAVPPLAVQAAAVSANTPARNTSSSSSAAGTVPVTAAAVATTPAATTAASANPESASSSKWLLKRNAVGKQRRLEEFHRLTWPLPPDEPGETELTALKNVWRPLVTPDLAFLLFPIVRPGQPVNQDVYVPGMSAIATQLECPHLPHHAEFILRWCCILLCLKVESSSGLLTLLQLVCDVFRALICPPPAGNNSSSSDRDGATTFNEVEASYLLPHLLEKSGHRSERHQLLYREAIELLVGGGGGGLMSNRSTVVSILTNALHSPNKRSRIVCLEQLLKLVQEGAEKEARSAGGGAGGGGGDLLNAAALREVGAYLDAKDCDLQARTACLDVLYAVYSLQFLKAATTTSSENAGDQAAAVVRMRMHFSRAGVSEHAVTMLEERIQKGSANSSSSVSVATTTTATTTAGAGVASNGTGSVNTKTSTGALQSAPSSSAKPTPGRAAGGSHSNSTKAGTPPTGTVEAPVSTTPVAASGGPTAPSSVKLKLKSPLLVEDEHPTGSSSSSSGAGAGAIAAPTGGENQDVFAMSGGSIAGALAAVGAEPMISPKSEMRSHRKLLEQIDDEEEEVQASSSAIATPSATAAAAPSSSSYSSTPATVKGSAAKRGAATTAEKAIRGKGLSSTTSSGSKKANNVLEQFKMPMDSPVTAATAAASAKASTPSASTSSRGGGNSSSSSSSNIKKSSSPLISSSNNSNGVDKSSVSHSSSSPATTTIPPTPASEGATAIMELESIYLDIEAKVAALVDIRTAVKDTDPVQEECKDYLKMLHSIINGEWSAEKLPEDEAVLLDHCETLVRLLVRCIARSFELPAVESNPVADVHLGVDISLLAISLSALFALVKRPEVSARLSEDVLFEVFHVCLHHICDERIAHLAQQSPVLGSESKETAQQVVRALNMIVLKLGVDGSVSRVLCVLLRIMFCCLPASELRAQHVEEHRPLPSTSTKPTSRLVIQVLSEQSSKAEPYVEPATDLLALLEGVHGFFSRHPTSTSDDTPFRTAKTVLNEVVRVKGGVRVLELLRNTDIPSSAFIYQLTSRLGNVKLQQQQQQQSDGNAPGSTTGSRSSSTSSSSSSSSSPSSAVASLGTDGQLHAQLVNVIDSITSSRDKVAAIRELHKIKRAHPEINIHSYLSKISTAFRRYVLNTLAKLDAAEPSPTSGGGGGGGSGDEAVADAPVSTTSTTTVSHPNVAATSSTSKATATTKTTPSPSRKENAGVYGNNNNNSNNNNHTGAAVLSGFPSSASGSADYSAKLSATTGSSVAGGTVSASARSTAAETGRLSVTVPPPSGSASKAVVDGLDSSNANTNASTPLTAGKMKRFAFNPESKRMEIMMVDIGDGVGGSPPHISGESSPFARKNDLIRNSLSHLTSSLNLPRGGANASTNTSTSAGNATSGGNLDALLDSMTKKQQPSARPQQL